MSEKCPCCEETVDEELILVCRKCDRVECQQCAIDGYFDEHVNDCSSPYVCCNCQSKEEN